MTDPDNIRQLIERAETIYPTRERGLDFGDMNAELSLKNHANLYSAVILKMMIGYPAQDDEEPVSAAAYMNPEEVAWLVEQLTGWLAIYGPRSNPEGFSK